MPLQSIVAHIAPGCCCAGLVLQELRRALDAEGLPRRVVVQLTAAPDSGTGPSCRKPPRIVIDGVLVADHGVCALECQSPGSCDGVPARAAIRAALRSGR